MAQCASIHPKVLIQSLLPDLSLKNSEVSALQTAACAPLRREYEREYANGSWIPIPECSLTTATLCNITQDISASVAYKLRVRAELGASRSPWATTEGFFNRATSASCSPATAWGLGCSPVCAPCRAHRAQMCTGHTLLLSSSPSASRGFPSHCSWTWVHPLAEPNSSGLEFQGFQR